MHEETAGGDKVKPSKKPEQPVSGEEKTKRADVEEPRKGSSRLRPKRANALYYGGPTNLEGTKTKGKHRGTKKQPKTTLHRGGGRSLQAGGGQLKPKSKDLRAFAMEKKDGKKTGFRLKQQKRIIK